MANLLHLILILSVLCIFIPNSLEDGTACKEQIEMIVDCWLHYGDPPLCKRKSSMVLCAEERFDSVLNCSSITLRKIKRMVYSYGATEKVLCEDNADLQTELETRKPCWSILRSCALQVMMVEEDAAEEMCKDVMSLLSICTRISHSCNSVYTPFIKSVISASNCKQFRVIVDAAPTENSLTQLLKQSAGNNLSLAILYSLLHKVQAKDNCKVILEDVKNCWIKYPEVPSSGCNTGTNTSLVKCSIKNLKILQSCDFHKSWEGAHVTELYTKAMDIICEDESLQKEFEKDEECWKEAHLCATHIITLPKKKNNELCKNASALLNDCKSKDQNPSRNKNCSEHIGTFVNTLFESSQVCGVAMLLGQVSFVLIAYLVASFLSL